MMKYPNFRLDSWIHVESIQKIYIEKNLYMKDHPRYTGSHMLLILAEGDFLPHILGCGSEQECQDLKVEKSREIERLLSERGGE